MANYDVNVLGERLVEEEAHEEETEIKEDEENEEKEIILKE